MSFLFKDFLSFKEVGEYLASHGYYYNLDNEFDHNRLKNFIIDLYRERKLMPFFFYSGWGVATITNRTDCKIVDKREAYLKGYFCLVEIGEVIRISLKDEKIIDIKQYHCYPHHSNEIFRLPLYADEIDLNIESSNLTSVELEVGKPSYFITFDDLRFTKKTLDQILNEQSEMSSSETKELKLQPNDAYITPAMKVMNAVINEFWLNYDIDQPAPKQSTITKWITDNFDGVSDALALNIDKVCRHSDAKSGGQYKR